MNPITWIRDWIWPKHESAKKKWEKFDPQEFEADVILRSSLDEVSSPKKMDTKIIDKTKKVIDNFRDQVRKEEIDK